jgi:prophage maintenance system killer protein
MNESPNPLSLLLGQIRFYLQEPLDFRQTDSRSTMTKVRVLSAAANYFNTLAVTVFGGRSGEARAPGLIEQVIAPAFQTYAGEDPHPDHVEKAAMLLRGITQGHPYSDGNKRTGFLVAGYYLKKVGHPWPAELPVDEVVDFCLAVSAGELRDMQALPRSYGAFGAYPSRTPPPAPDRSLAIAQRDALR